MTAAIVALLAVGILLLWSIHSHLREWHAQWEMELSIRKHDELLATLASTITKEPETIFDQDTVAS